MFLIFGNWAIFHTTCTPPLSFESYLFLHILIEFIEDCKIITKSAIKRRKTAPLAPLQKTEFKTYILRLRGVKTPFRPNLKAFLLVYGIFD
jgi:hypothetical protein